MRKLWDRFANCIVEIIARILRWPEQSANAPRINILGAFLAIAVVKLSMIESF